MEILNRIYSKASEVVTRKIGDRIVVIPTESNSKEKEATDNVFAFNDMAAGIWVQINGLTPLKNIKAKIIDYFEIDSVRAEKDLIDFILQLEESGLIYCDKEK